VGRCGLEDPPSIYRSADAADATSTLLGDVADAGSPPVEVAPFVCGQTAPDTIVLVGLDGPLQTRFNDLAPMANGL